MSKMILCLTRGGEASYPNQDKAISIAKERSVDLLFLYVTNVQFLGMTAFPKVVDIEAELDEMGDFLLAMAQERAEKAGVKAITAVRRGEFREVINNVLREHPINTIVMGSSAQGAGLVTVEYIQELAEEISRESGVEFVILDEGEIVGKYMFEPPVDGEG